MRRERRRTTENTGCIRGTSTAASRNAPPEGTLDSTDTGHSTRQMHAGALRALEFDRIVEAVRRFALTPPGEARLERLSPHDDPRDVAAALAATAEAARFLGDNQLELQAPAELELILSSLQVEG